MIKEVSVDEAIKMLKEDENVILLDVRTQQEYYTEHVKGSKWMPLDQVPYRLQEVNKKNKRITAVLIIAFLLLLGAIGFFIDKFYFYTMEAAGGIPVVTLAALGIA